jgi:hypothetical protein
MLGEEKEQKPVGLAALTRRIVRKRKDGGKRIYRGSCFVDGNEPSCAFLKFITNLRKKHPDYVYKEGPLSLSKPFRNGYKSPFIFCVSSSLLD